MVSVRTSASPTDAASAISERDLVSEGRIAVLPYLAIVGQLGLLLLLFRQFQIESQAFRIVAALAAAGFVVHAWLPLRYRLTFFSVLSIVGIVVTLGVTTSAWLLILGSALIGICHLPFSARARTALLLCALAALAVMRAGWIEAPWPRALWPILGSMFMFRLIIYFYDLRHDKAPPSLARSFAYFFMLPNVCFPVFPVIDFKAFRRNYFDADAFQIYQTGIHWMLRGAIHLILYRVVYYYWTLAPSEVINPGDFLQYVAANFLLYLRISGLFHLIVGMLYLFGFRLPETHHRYLLASSFTDFWRRINIYWKDFMLKIFYYPTVFRLKHLGPLRAMVIATVLVFAATWFLHAYQWFWLRGSYLLAPQDVLFWAILGGLVVVNSLYEAHHGRKRVLSRTTTSWRTKGATIARTFVFFWFLCVLWSLWTSESIEQWLGLWSAIEGEWTWRAFLIPLGVLAVIVAGNVEPAGPRNAFERTSMRAFPNVIKASWAPATVLVAFIAIGIEPVQLQIGTGVANVVHSLRSGRLSRLDVAKLERGYYEDLLSVDRFNSQLWEIYAKRPPNLLGIEGANLKRFTNDFAGYELMPSRVSISTYGPITVNRWGMRDRDYELVPPPDTFRFVILGPSNVMGWGVADGETFESLLEKRLNEDGESTGGSHIEILNFAVPGYEPPQELVAFDKALRFSPQGVIYVAVGRELSQAARYLAQAAHNGLEIPYPELRSIVDRAGVVPGMDETEALRRLRPVENDILTWIYSYVVEKSRAVGARPILAFVPQVRSGLWEEETAGTIEIARKAGFIVMDLADIYEGQDIDQIRVAEWDDHPNARGHRMIADRLTAEFKAHRQEIFGGGQDSIKTASETKR
jgi:hypothetical protein